mgnify:CR=1 FL=1
MKLSTLLQEKAANGFTATVLGWPGLEMTASTRDEALQNIRQAIKDCLSKSELVTVDIDHELSDPWAKFVGMWEDDPYFDEFLEEIAAYRRERDADERR